MRELALNVLDNRRKLAARGRKVVKITLAADFAADTMSIEIGDDGCGMSEEMLATVCDPFTTTRTTRKVGMGVPLFKYSAESAGGTFSIRSEVGKGPCVTATYKISHVDRMPLGDFGGVALQLVTMNPATDYCIRVTDGSREGVLDTREIKEIRGKTFLSARLRCAPS